MKLSTYTNSVKTRSYFKNELSLGTESSSRGAVSVFTFLTLLSFLNKLGTHCGVRLHKQQPHTPTHYKQKITTDSNFLGNVPVYPKRLNYINTAVWFLNTHAAARVLGNRSKSSTLEFKRFTLYNYTVVHPTAPNYQVTSTRTWISTFRRMFKKMYTSMQYLQVTDLKTHAKYSRARFVYWGPSTRKSIRKNNSMGTNPKTFYLRKKRRHIVKKLRPRFSWKMKVANWANVRKYYKVLRYHEKMSKVRYLSWIGAPWAKWRIPRTFRIQVPFRARRFKRTWYKTYRHKELKSQKKNWTFFRAGTWGRRTRWGCHNSGLGFEGSVAYTYRPGAVGYRATRFRKATSYKKRAKIYRLRKNTKVRAALRYAQKAIRLSKVSRFSKNYANDFKHRVRYTRLTLLRKAVHVAAPPKRTSFVVTARYNYFKLNTPVDFLRRGWSWFQAKAAPRLPKRLAQEAVGIYFDTKRKDLLNILKLRVLKRRSFNYRNTSMSIIERVAAATALQHVTGWGRRSVFKLFWAYHESLEEESTSKFWRFNAVADVDGDSPLKAWVKFRKILLNPNLRFKKKYAIPTVTRGFVRRYRTNRKVRRLKIFRFKYPKVRWKLRKAYRRCTKVAKWLTSRAWPTFPPKQVLRAKSPIASCRVSGFAFKGYGDYVSKKIKCYTFKTPLRKNMKSHLSFNKNKKWDWKDINIEVLRRGPRKYKCRRWLRRRIIKATRRLFRRRYWQDFVLGLVEKNLDRYRCRIKTPPKPTKPRALHRASVKVFVDWQDRLKTPRPIFSTRYVYSPPKNFTPVVVKTERKSGIWSWYNRCFLKKTRKISKPGFDFYVYRKIAPELKVFTPTASEIIPEVHPSGLSSAQRAVQYFRNTAIERIIPSGTARPVKSKPTRRNYQLPKRPTKWSSKARQSTAFFRPAPVTLPTKKKKYRGPPKKKHV